MTRSPHPRQKKLVRELPRKWRHGAADIPRGPFSAVAGTGPVSQTVMMGSTTIEQHQELMDVHGLDLLAQVEAMQRHALQYQREVHRLRGLLERTDLETGKPDATSGIRHHLAEMRRACTSFNATLDEIDDNMDAVEHHGNS
jgi:hypothetical protein